MQPLLVRLADLQRLEIKLDVEVGHDRHELLGEANLVGILRERLPSSFARDLLCMLEDSVHAAVLLQELERRLGTHALRAGDVVGGVADQGQVVDDLGGGDAKLLVGVALVHPLGRYAGGSPSSRVQQMNPGPD